MNWIEQGLKSLYTARNDVNLIYEWAAVESNDIVPECSTCVIVSRYKVPCCHILSRCQGFQHNPNCLSNYSFCTKHISKCLHPKIDLSDCYEKLGNHQ